MNIKRVNYEMTLFKKMFYVEHLYSNNYLLRKSSIFTNY